MAKRKLSRPRKAAAPKLSALLRGAGFSLNPNGDAQKIIAVPNGELRCEITRQTMANITKPEHLVQVVALLGYNGGRLSLKDGVRRLESERMDASATIARLRQRLTDVARMASSS